MVDHPDRSAPSGLLSDLSQLLVELSLTMTVDMTLADAGRLLVDDGRASLVKSLRALGVPAGHAGEAAGSGLLWCRASPGCCLAVR